MSDVKVTIPRDDYDPNQRTDIDVEVVNPDGSVSTKTVKGAVQATTQEDGSVSFGILASAHVPFVAGGGSYVDEVTGESSLVAYWRLGESSGTTASDNGGVYNGTYSGTPTLGVTGIPGSGGDTAATFDGTDDVVTISGSSNFWPDTNGVAYELWYKGTDAGSNAGAGTVGTTCGLFCANTSSANKRFVIGIDADGKVRAYTSIDYDMTGPTTAVVNDGDWHHIVYTIEGTTYNTAIYIDGVLDSSSTDNNSPGSGTPDVTIGDNPRASAGEAAGTIDEVAIYRGDGSATALTAARILAHYNAGSTA